MNASEKPRRRSVDWLAAAAPILAGLGAGLAYADERLFWLAWVALVPLGLSWSHRARPTMPLGAAFLGGLFYHCLALSWMRTCYAHDAAQWFGPRAPIWLAISLVAAAFFAAMCQYGQYLVRVVRLPVALALPIAWVSMELAKQYAGLLFVESEFPWARLGLTQSAWLPMAQTADLGGELLLSFLVCLANGAIVDLWGVVRRSSVLPRYRTLGGAMAGAALLVAAWSYGHWRMSQGTGEPGPVVCLMGELDLPPLLDKTRIDAARSEQQTDGLTSSADQPPDLLLWSELAWHHKLMHPARSPDDAWPANPPEDLTQVAYTDLSTYSRFVRDSLRSSAAAIDAVLVLGCERMEAAGNHWRRYNSVVGVDPSDGAITSYDKRRLVPWGEFVPFMASASTDLAEVAVPGTDTSYQRGGDPPVFRVSSGPRTYQFRAAICYDLCFASHFRPEDLQERQVDFFVHCGSEGQDPRGEVARIMLKTAQLRAIETRRAVVRNVDYGYSGIVDSSGMAQIRMERGSILRPELLPPVPIDDRTSLYTMWGEWPLGLLCATVALVAWRRKKNERRGTSQSS